MSDELKPFNTALYGAIRKVLESARQGACLVESAQVGPVGHVGPVGRE